MVRIFRGSVSGKIAEKASFEKRINNAKDQPDHTKRNDLEDISFG